jgi:zinc ribbon protein/PilZ domain-containing protein
VISLNLATHDAVGLHFRRSSRIPVVVPITLCGLDDLGAVFEENTQTLDVSKNGAKIVAAHRLTSNAELMIWIASSGRTCRAKVIWSSTTLSSGHGFETGIEIVEPVAPDLVWPIESPPRDWIGGCPPPTADERLEYLCQRARSHHPAVQASTGTARTRDDGATVPAIAAANFKMTPVAGEFRARAAHAASVQAHTSAGSRHASVEGTSQVKGEVNPMHQAARGTGKLTLLGLSLQEPRMPAVVTHQPDPAPTEPTSNTEAVHPPTDGATSESNGNGHKPPARAKEEPARPVEASAGPCRGQIEHSCEIQQRVFDELGEVAIGGISRGYSMPIEQNVKLQADHKEGGVQSNPGDGNGSGSRAALTASSRAPFDQTRAGAVGDAQRELAALETQFSAMAERLSGAVRDLQAGRGPSPGLAAEVEACQSHFAILREHVAELAQSSGVSATSVMQSSASTEDLRTVLNAVAEAEQQRRVFGEARDRALNELAPVLCLVRRDGTEFAALDECQARARQLLEEIGRSEWPRLHAECQPLLERQHAFCRLLDLVRDGEELSDEAWESAEGAVTAAFGKPLAIAATRGRLRLRSQTGDAGDTTERCPSCGADLDPGARFCGECSAKVA